MELQILPNLAAGLGNAFHFVNFFFLALGTLVGVVAGALPGISAVNAMALALPFTHFMSPVVTMLFLTGIYVGGIFGGSISAILLNIPGSPGSLPATWDGYPMTQKGQAAKALGIAITCSAVGGIFSALLMIFFSPPFARFALSFDQPEFFAATMLGFVCVVAISHGHMLAGVLSLFTGLIVATIGFDYLYSVPRLTFGSEILESRINFVVVLIGMFALGEVLFNLTKKTAQLSLHGGEGHTRLPRWADIRRIMGAMLRGSGIGCMIGIVPGAGGLVGALMAYGVEKQVSKRSDEFGTGVEEGLAAPETAKNATTGAATIPMLTLGIPGSASTAVMMSALMVKGINPGPILFVEGKELIYTIFAGYLLANVLMVILGMVVARGFSYVMKMPPALLYSVIVILAIVGTISVRGNPADLFYCVFFGVLGYLMKRFSIPTTPMILGVILGPLAEPYFLITMASYDTLTVFFTRPKSAIILALAFSFLAWSLWPSVSEWLGRRRKET